MKEEPGKVWKVITFEASWFDEGACGSFRVLLMLTSGPALIEARGATGSGTGLIRQERDLTRLSSVEPWGLLFLLGSEQ